jgi:hypothetical protein
VSIGGRHGLFDSGSSGCFFGIRVCGRGWLFAIVNKEVIHGFEKRLLSMMRSDNGSDIRPFRQD